MTINTTPRAKAIAYRLETIEQEKRVIRNARDNYLFSAEEIREGAQEIMANQRRQLVILRALPESVTMVEVRPALGYPPNY